MYIMKKLLFLIVFGLSATLLYSQSKSSSQKETKEDRNFRIPLIGETAPSFKAESTNGMINFPSQYGKKWKVLVSHPQDFTPVCSSEILELANIQSELDKLNVQVVVVSTDPLDTHTKWKQALEEMSFQGKEKASIKFPLVDDQNIAISKKYGMIHTTSNSTKSVRGVFVIDPDNIIQATSFYPMSVGRSTHEILRLVSALQTTASAQVMTPANWKPGNDVLVPYQPTSQSGTSEKDPEGYYSAAWFMWYKKVN